MPGTRPRDGGLTNREVEAPAPPGGDVRSYGASLGTIPDSVGPREGRAGIRRGDVLVRLASTEIGDIYDFVSVLRDSKPGETATAVVLRDGERVELTVTFGESTRR